METEQVKQIALDIFGTKLKKVADELYVLADRTDYKTPQDLLIPLMIQEYAIRECTVMLTAGLAPGDKEIQSKTKTQLDEIALFKKMMMLLNKR